MKLLLILKKHGSRALRANHLEKWQAVDHFELLPDVAGRQLLHIYKNGRVKTVKLSVNFTLLVMPDRGKFKPI